MIDLLAPRAPAIAALMIVLVLGVHFARDHRHRLDELDEAAVIYSTSYLDLVLEGRFDAPEWQAIDAIDHPPAWKYAHGIARAVGGRPARTLAEKDLWLDWAWEAGEQHEAFKRHTAAAVPIDDLVPGRTLSALAVLGAALIFLWCAARASSPVGASVAASLLAIHATVKWVSTRALIDGLLLFGVLATTALTIRWLERDPRDVRRALPWSVGLGVALGVLAQTKITGGVGGVAAAIALAVYLLHRRSAGDRGRVVSALASLGVVAAVAVAVAIALNPSMWRDPVGFVTAMLEHRALQLRLQMLFGNPDGWVPVSEGLRRFLFRSVLWTDPIYRAVGVPAIAFAVALGAIRAARIEDPAKAAARIALLAQLTVWALTTLGTYRMDWPRYMLPALPLLTLLTAEALLYLGGLMVERKRPAWPPLVAAAAAAALVVVAVSASTKATGEERDRRLRASVEFLDAELTRTASTSRKARALGVRRDLFERRLADPSSDPIR